VRVPTDWRRPDRSIIDLIPAAPRRARGAVRPSRVRRRRRRVVGGRRPTRLVRGRSESWAYWFLGALGALVIVVRLVSAFG